MTLQVEEDGTHLAGQSLLGSPDTAGPRAPSWQALCDVLPPSAEGPVLGQRPEVPLLEEVFFSEVPSQERGASFLNYQLNSHYSTKASFMVPSSPESSAVKRQQRRHWLTSV